MRVRATRTSAKRAASDVERASHALCLSCLGCLSCLVRLALLARLARRAAAKAAEQEAAKAQFPNSPTRQFPNSPTRRLANSPISRATKRPSGATGHLLASLDWGPVERRAEPLCERRVSLTKMATLAILGRKSSGCRLKRARLACANASHFCRLLLQICFRLLSAALVTFVRQIRQIWPRASELATPTATTATTATQATQATQANKQATSNKWPPLDSWAELRRIAPNCEFRSLAGSNTIGIAQQL